MYRTATVLLIVLSGIIKPAVGFAAFPSTHIFPHPSPIVYTDSMLLKITGLSAKAIEKTTGYHLTLKERLALKLLHHKLKTTGNKNLTDSTGNDRIEKQALWAKWLGIGSLIGLFVPGVGLLSLPAAIVAIVLGSSTVKKTKHPKYAKQGIVFGIVTVLLLLLVGLIVLLVTQFPVR